MRIFLILFLSTFFLVQIAGQNAQFVKRASFQFQDQPLEYVLEQLSDEFNIQFAYSKEIVDVDQLVSLSINDEALSEVLDQLFAQTKIVYASIGGQIVLKTDEKKIPIPIGGGDENDRLSSGRTHPKEDKTYKIEGMKTDSPLQKRRELAKGEWITLEPKALDGGQMPSFEIDYSELSFGKVVELDAILDTLWSNIRMEWEEKINQAEQNITINLPNLDSTAVQIGLNPDVELTTKEIETKNVAFHLFWGKTPAIEGIAIGGLGSRVERDIEGLQLSSLRNVVEGNLYGSQISLLFNRVRGEVIGSQIGGLRNVAQRMVGVQAAGLSNKTKGSFGGVQIASLSNRANEAVGGSQFAGLYNRAKGKINTQVGLINHADSLRGVQIGLINFANDVKGAPIGLISFVKNGYNRMELSYSPQLGYQMGIKLGAKGFYNIFQGTIDRSNKIINNWGLGYGIGTYISNEKRWGLNFELLGIHVNESEEWTTDLNLLTKLRMTLDLRLGKRFSLFVGPDMNLMISRVFDADTMTYGSSIAPENLLYEYTNTVTNISPLPISVTTTTITDFKGWISLNAGIRF